MCIVRRLIQVFALLMMILAGSLPGLRLLGPARPESCCANLPACPCLPSRSPAPTAPCGLSVTAPVAVLAAPCRQAQVRPARTEPSPFPTACLARFARLPLTEPCGLARPGPTPPPSPTLDRPALLSVFRI
jgi:hypothetical protein